MDHGQFLFFKDLFILILMTKFIGTNAQGNIFQFSPDQPHCLGEEVTLTCYLFPTGPAYSNFVLISFNQSTPESASTINTERASSGYSATVAIPVMGSSARIQLTIASFQVSDNNTLFGCHAEFSSDATVTGALESGYPPIANPPSQPTIISGFPTNCTLRTISWTAPTTDRYIKKYYIYRDGIPVNTTNTTTTSYTDRFKLIANTEHNYSVVAESCAGNSTNEKETKFNVTVDLGKELNVTYDKNITVDIDWTLNCVTTAPFSVLTYYLELNYTHTQENNASNNSITETFSQPSDNTSYSVTITQPNIPSITNMTVVTDISVCINITKQNGMSFSGIRLCEEYSTATSIGTPPPSPTPSTTSVIDNTTTPTNAMPISEGVIIGIVVGAVLVLFGCCILIIVILIIIFFTKKGKGYSIFSTSKQSQGNLVNDVDKDLYTQVTKSKKKVEIPMQATTRPQELLYADLDLVASHAKEVTSTIQETHYTSVKAMFDGPK